MEGATKVTFICGTIPDRINCTRYQRSLLLTEGFETYVVSRKGGVPRSLKERFAIVCPTLGRLALFQTILWVTYLRVAKKSRIIYTRAGLGAIVVGLLAKKLLGCVWFYDLWDHPSLEFYTLDVYHKRVKKWLFEAFLRNALKSADHWNIAMQEGIMNHLPAPGPATIVAKVTNGVDPSLMRAVQARPAQQQAESEGTLRICYSGWITMERGLPLVIEYLSERQECSGIEVRVFGQCTREALESIVRHNRHSANRIRYLGMLEQQVALQETLGSDVCLCLLDQCVINYRFAYPVKLFEYLALGKIVIATRTPATQEIIDDGMNGFLISNNIVELSRSIDRIRRLKGSEEIEGIRRSAMNSIEPYSWERINSKITKSLQALGARLPRPD